MKKKQDNTESKTKLVEEATKKLNEIRAQNEKWYSVFIRETMESVFQRMFGRNPVYTDPKRCASCNEVLKKEYHFCGFIMPGVHSTQFSDIPMKVCETCGKRLTDQQGFFWKQTQAFYVESYKEVFQLAVAAAMNQSFETTFYNAIDNLILAGKILVLTAPPTESKQSKN